MAAPTYLTQWNSPSLAAQSPYVERWRCRKTGPNFHKLGGKIGYSLADIEAYERRRRAETHSSILGSWE